MKVDVLCLTRRSPRNKTGRRAGEKGEHGQDVQRGRIGKGRIEQGVLRMKRKVSARLVFRQTLDRRAHWDEQGGEKYGGDEMGMDVDCVPGRTLQLLHALVLPTSGLTNSSRYASERRWRSTSKDRS